MGETVVVKGIALILAAGCCAAQDASINVYSEFRRIDPFGRIVTPDRGGNPREILSPAVARNAYASFRIAVKLPKNTPTWLYIQQNPELFGVRLYREQYTKVRQEWIPDGLQPVKAPAFVILPDLASPIAGQNTQSYWLDLWVPGDAPVDRVRVQVVIKAGEDWIQYPMEVRVVGSVAEGLTPLPMAMPALRGPITGAWLAGWTALPGPAREGPLTVRRVVMRNARQDRALAEAASAPEPPEGGDPEWPLDWRRKVLRGR